MSRHTATRHEPFRGDGRWYVSQNMGKQKNILAISYLDFPAKIPPRLLVSVSGKLLLTVFGGAVAENLRRPTRRMEETHMAITKSLPQKDQYQ